MQSGMSERGAADDVFYIKLVISNRVKFSIYYRGQSNTLRGHHLVPSLYLPHPLYKASGRSSREETLKKVQLQEE